MTESNKPPIMQPLRSRDLRVVAAALRTTTGLIISEPPPVRHWKLMQKARELGITEDLGPEQQGFLLNTGVFVRRKPALAIARRGNQIINDGPISGAGLLSEDLWDNE